MMDSSIGFILLMSMLGGMAGAWLYADTKNTQLSLVEEREIKPYTWGYFYGAFGLIAFGVSCLFHLIVLSMAVLGSFQMTQEASIVMPMLVFLLATKAVLHYFVIRRNRLAFVLATILSFNVLLAIINFFYIKNRWAELEPRKEK